MRIGITSTIPSEIVLAAGHTLVDLNNAFMASPNRLRYVAAAENAGFPASCCGWIRGIYGAVAEGLPIDSIIAVTGGDCSNTHALAEVLSLDGIPIIPFSYPFTRDAENLSKEMAAFAANLGTTVEAAEAYRTRLEHIRVQLDSLDTALADCRISPSEYCDLALSSSDYASNLEAYTASLVAAAERANTSRPSGQGIRIALVGVPPIIPDVFDVLEAAGLRAVFIEVPRQFAMPVRNCSLVDQYLAYTYPYGMTSRIVDIREQCAARGIAGIIHYTQNFCFRAIEDVVLRRSTELPILTIEGDEPVLADERLRIRIETFAELLASEHK